MKIGDRMKNRRQQLKLTLEDVASVAGVSRQTIQRYESGVISNIPSDKIELVAKALKTTPAYLMGWDDEENSKTYYQDELAAEIAQEMFDRPELKVLFDTTKDVSADDLKFVIDMIERMKK